MIKEDETKNLILYFIYFDLQRMNMNRILIVNANWLGDVLFSTPAIRAIRKKYPNSFMACLAPARVKNILLNNPHLNEVITYDDRVNFISVREIVRVVNQIRKRKLDSAIFFHRSKTKVLLAMLAGIQQRIGFEAPFRRKLLTQGVRMPQEGLHRIDTYLYLLEQAGIPSDGRHMEFYPDPQAQETLWEKVERPDRYVVLHVGGNWPLKRWPVDYFVQWTCLWLKEFRGKIVLCGTEAEADIAQQIQSHFSKEEVVSLCGKTSLDELGWLLKKAEFLLSNDSGPIHLAATQKTKILGLFGPTSPELTGPVSLAPMRIIWKDVGCEIPCYFRSCHYRVCMEWLTPQEVFEQARALCNPSVS